MSADSTIPQLLDDCAKTFRFYEQSHRQKRTADADAKAERNRIMAERCEAALAAILWERSSQRQARGTIA